MALTGIATNVAADIASTIVAAVVQQIKDVVELEENIQLLINTDFKRMEVFLRYIDKQFQEQQRRVPEPVELCLTRMNAALTQAKLLVDRVKSQRRRYFGCCLLCNTKLTTEVTNWETRFAQLFQELHNDFAITANAGQIVSTAATQEGGLLQDVAPDDIVGSTFESAQTKLQTWLEPHCKAHVVGLYGMGGVGKTSVLKAIHDNYKQKVSPIFDIIIWFTVSKYKTEEEDNKITALQFSIAHTLHLDLKDCPTLEKRKMTLSVSLENKRFLLILDDLWSDMDLDKVGVKFGHDKGSKVLVSSRSTDVIKAMGAVDSSLVMEPLSAEDGWMLFRRIAFAKWAVPEILHIESIAEEIAKECKGLPLALNVVAAALSSEKNLNKWRDALAFMNSVDPSFQETHSTIDAKLYQRLRWSYNDLSDALKSCFLYCAAFPEDAQIDVETLVEMWCAEGLVIRRGITSLMDVGRHYIDVLLSRCLIEYVGLKKIRIQYMENLSREVEREVIKVHDVLRDMAIYIGQREEHWVFASGQHLRNFPREEVTRNCKRVSVGHNDIQDLPPHLECTELVSLVLSNNPNLAKVPAASLSNMMSLKVLDLSCCTLITSLPTSVGQLQQLEFLNLTGCYRLEELPESICGLSRLQFLNLQCCQSLRSLPDKIGALQSLKHLNLDGCGSVVIQRDIFGLTSLTKLCLPRVGRGRGRAISMEDLRNLRNLMEMSIAVKASTMSNCDCTWLEMRKVTLTLVYDARTRTRTDSNVAVDDRDADALMVDILPLQNMNRLQSLSLTGYRGVSLPNYICKFQNLETLKLVDCHQLRELPVLEIGSDSARDSFPMLKRLVLRRSEKLESITGSYNASNGGTMLKLQSLTILDCPLLKIEMEMDRLSNLREIMGYELSHSSIWKDEGRRVKFEKLFKDYRTTG